MLEHDRGHARGINLTERMSALDSHTDRVIEHERLRIDASIECGTLLQSLKKRIMEIVGCSSRRRNVGEMISPIRLARSQCSCCAGRHGERPQQNCAKPTRPSAVAILADWVSRSAGAVVGASDLGDDRVVAQALGGAVATMVSPKKSLHSAKPRFELRIAAPFA